MYLKSIKNLKKLKTRVKILNADFIKHRSNTFFRKQVSFFINKRNAFSSKSSFRQTKFKKITMRFNFVLL